MKQFAADIPIPMLTNKVSGLTIGLILSALSHLSYSQTSPPTPSSTHFGAMVKQTLKESWADVEPLGQDIQGVYYLGIPNTEAYSGSVVADADYYLFLVNNDAELVKHNPAKFSVDGRKSRYEFTHEINGKIMVFTSVEKKNEKLVSFYAQEIDKNNLQLSDAKKIVELSFANEKHYKRVIFKSDMSTDKSKLLISYGLEDGEGSILAFGYVVLGNAMNGLYKFSGTVDKADGVYLFDQFRVSNKGAVFLKTRYLQNEKAYVPDSLVETSDVASATLVVENRKNYEYRIVTFENNTSKIFSIPNRNKFYDVLDMDIAPDGDLILIGFYSPRENESMPIGAVALKVNPGTGAIKESAKEFGDTYEMPSDISNKSNVLVAGSDQYLKYRFIVSDVQFNKNGGFTLIGERNVTQTKRTQQTIHTVNNLDDLAVVDVSASGNINGVYKVEKSQQADDVQLFNASYFYVENNNNKYIAFANMGKSNFRESVLVTIAPDGNQKREVMFSTKDADVTIKPKDCKFYNGNLLMYGSKNNRYVRWMSRPL